MILAATLAHPKETGGILAGVISRGRFWITNAVEIPSRTSSACHYEIPRNRRPECVDRLRRLDARIGYLGDWHSHTANVGASSQDESAMRMIAASGEAAKPYCVMIIVRRDGSDYVLEGSTWGVKGHEPARFIMAGEFRP